MRFGVESGAPVITTLNEFVPITPRPHRFV